MCRGMSAARRVWYEQCEQNSSPSRTMGSLSSWMGTYLLRGAVLRTRPQRKDGFAGRDALERARPERELAFLPCWVLELCEGATAGAGSGEEKIGEVDAEVIGVDDTDVVGEKMLVQSEVDAGDTALGELLMPVYALYDTVSQG